MGRMWLGVAAAGTTVSDYGCVLNCLSFLWPYPRLRALGNITERLRLDLGGTLVARKGKSTILNFSKCKEGGSDIGQPKEG